MQLEISDAINILGRTPATVDALLRDQSPAWLNCRIEANSFSATDVLGHLILGEMTDWIPRARIILECQKSRAFDPFDRRGFDSLLQGRSVNDLLDEFGRLRRGCIESLKSLNLDDQKLALEGFHPELGPVTMRQLIATWVAHDLGHIAQLMRIMASQYRDEVGPWRAYLSIISDSKNS